MAHALVDASDGPRPVRADVGGAGSDQTGQVSRYRPDIDGLRALAVLPVLLYHFGAAWAPGGFTGVDVFFVISGFVIAGSIQEDIEAGKFTIANFYFKRVKRILPALLATLLLTTIAAIIFLLPSDLINYGWSTAATSSFVSNIFFWKTSGYFEAGAQTKPLLHTWSLAVEEQYYLLAPMAFALISRWGGKRWLLFLGPFLLLSFAASVMAVFLGPTAGYFLLPSRLWELLLGALLALSSRPMAGPRWIREAMGLLGFGLIIFGILTLREGDPFPGWNAGYPCVGAALLIQSGWSATPSAKPPLMNRILAMGPLVWIGRISYSLYLVHWPIAAFHKYVSLSEPSAIDAVWMLAASLGLAWLSWRFVEQPIRRTSRRRLPLVLWSQVAATFLGIGVGAVLVLSYGLPQRFPTYIERSIPGVEDWGGSACFNQNPTHATPWSAAACTRVHGTNGRILLWGDSFAAQYVPGILRDQARINADVFQYTFAGCPPLLGYFSYARVACAPFNRRALDIIKQEKIDTVVLSAKWADLPRGNIDQLGETVALLRSRGLRVYVFGQSPIFIVDVQQIDYLSGLSAQPGLVAWPTAVDPNVNVELARQSKGAVFVDPLSHLCAGPHCAYRNGNDFYYSDYGHFSTVGSLRAVQAYFPAGVPTSGPVENAGSNVSSPR